MSRRIISQQNQAAGAGEETDTYLSRLVKYIPADVVAAWIFLAAAIDSATDVSASTLLWLCFAALVVITPFYVLRLTRVAGAPPARNQSVISTAAFAVWVFALGGPFTHVAWYRPLYGSVVMVFFTLAVALISDPDPTPAAAGAGGPLGEPEST